MSQINEEFLINHLRNYIDIIDIYIKDDSEKHRGHAGYRAGGASHFRLKIVSNDFEGLSRIDRHRKIYEALKEPLQQQIHALAITALTEQEWRAAQSS